MNKPDYNALFSNHLIGRIIPGFPYSQRFCPYCEREMSLIKAIHLQKEIEHFKAIYVCQNKDCPVFDEDARKAYVRVSYSSEHAIEILEGIPIKYKRFTLDGVEKDIA